MFTIPLSPLVRFPGAIILIDTITETLKAEGKLVVPGLGAFEVKQHAARTGHNPRTGETVEIAAKKVPAFKAAKALKDAVE